MTREQWRNLYHSFRWMRRMTTDAEAVAWCSHFNSHNGIVLRKVVCG